MVLGIAVRCNDSFSELGELSCPPGYMGKSFTGEWHLSILAHVEVVHKVLVSAFSQGCL